MKWISLVLSGLSVHQPTFENRALMFVPHVPGKCPLPGCSRRPGANRAAKPLIDPPLISSRLTRATRGIGAQSRRACEAEHILVFWAANVASACRQRSKILPAELSLDLADSRTAPLGSSHRQCAVDAARWAYHSAAWLQSRAGRSCTGSVGTVVFVSRRCLLAAALGRWAVASMAARAGRHRCARRGAGRAPVALACARHRVPFAETRRISHRCGPRDGGLFDLATAVTHAARMLPGALS